MKRNIYKFLTGGLVLGTMLGTSSCLKNNKYYIDFSKVGTTVEMAMAPARAVTPPNALGYSTSLGAGFYLDSVNYSGNDTLPIYVNVASPSVPTTATTATLALDPTDFATYNGILGGVYDIYYYFLGLPAPQSNVITSGYIGIPNADGFQYEILPDSCYTVSSWTVTVPGGQRLAPLNVIVNVNKIDTSSTWIIDSTISNNPIEVLNHNYILPVTIASASQKVSNWKTVFVDVVAVPF
ncbi:MAG TPA: DUF1735 domain-containing protein [Chitinophagaceae bacterium]|nr:DUF1735 domain-containing protein [Chitinophagaceae bacterium]